jgi:hypothetical protein
MSKHGSGNTGKEQPRTGQRRTVETELKANGKQARTKQEKMSNQALHPSTRRL